MGPAMTLTASSATSQAERAIYFIERFIKLSHGEYYGQPLILRPWQREIIEGIFATDADGQRIHRTAYIGLPRKNGKSTLMAAVALYALIADSEPGAQVYSCAGDRTQAGIVFREARNMLLASPELSKRVTAFQHYLENPANGGIYRALSADAALQQGLNPSFVIFDEVHVQPNDRLWNAMVLGMGTRRQPLIVGITTAGYDTDTLAWKLYDHGKRVNAGELVDPAFFFRWWEPQSSDDDWRSADVWKLSNPAFGDFLKPESFEKDLTTPENEFRRFRLNQWTTTHSAWFPFGAWEKVADRKRIVSPDEPIALSFDGSWSGDSTALMGTTLGEKPHGFVIKAWEKPADSVGWRVDTDDVEQTIRETVRTRKVVSIACDPPLWGLMIQAFERDRLPVVEWPTNALARMVPACQDFYNAVMEERYSHDGDPRLARHVANAVLKDDRHGPRIVKESKSSPRKIDLAVTAVMGYAEAQRLNGVKPVTPGFISFMED